MRTIHLFRTHDIEKGTANLRNPRPGYHWHPAWAEALPDGATSQALLLSEHWEPGCRIARHRNEQAARDALDKQLPNA